VLGDILRPEVGMTRDVLALLKFASAHGFLKDALYGLASTALSDYRQLRTRVGLQRYGEDEMIEKLAAAGFAASRAQARQLVRHGHIEVNGKKINIPSYQARKGDVIQVREKSRKNDQIRQAVETASGRGVPSWLALNAEQFLGTVTDIPKREDIRLPIQEQLIVELYSK